MLEQTAVNAFGSVGQRVAAHLLDLASDRQRPGGRLVAHVSQQELADAAGSVREVVARALRDLRVAGIVATAADSVVIDGSRPAGHRRAGDRERTASMSAGKLALKVYRRARPLPCRPGPGYAARRGWTEGSHRGARSTQPSGY